ncbi:MAG TPA: O-antigen ligase family protein [Candidatus Nanoarchaeia archaeon]|nr:O-antigen ligase family protein [Candidatus Nanoarchaeia archaeon]
MANSELSNNLSDKNSRAGWWFGFIWLAVLIIGLAILATYFNPFRLALPFILTAIFLIIPEEYGLYSLAFFLPAIEWYFYYRGLEIPLIDLLGLAVFAAFILRKIYDRLFRREKFQLRLPVLIPFSFFIISAFISCFFADYVRDSIWYFVRWILFFYFVYVVFPVNAIKREIVLRNTVISLVACGVLVALGGLYSVFIQDWQYQFVRVIPLTFFNISPLGTNHNLLAEVLIVSLALTQSLKYWFTSRVAKRWLDILTFFQALVLVGTFSRAAWIGLGAMILLWLAVNAKKLSRSVWVILIMALIILSPLFVYMYRLQSQYDIGVSSTENRLIMTEIAWDKFLDKPVFGQGDGTFINFIADDIRFIAKYGEPLDSHGVWQKIILENGLFGVFTFALLLAGIFIILGRFWKRFGVRYPWFPPLVLGSIGIVIMEFFNTSYYKGKMWLPIALALAAVNLIRAKERKIKYGKN